MGKIAENIHQAEVDSRGCPQYQILNEWVHGIYGLQPDVVTQVILELLNLNYPIYGSFLAETINLCKPSDA